VNQKNFALVLGVVFVLVGLMGMTQIGVSEYTGPTLTIKSEQGDLLHLFHVNVLHNLVHLLFGLFGIFAWFAGARAARVYCQVTGVVYLLLVVLGLIPATNSTFGLIPIDQHDIWLHALIGAAACYFGFIAGSTTPLDTTTGGPTTTPVV
jgi:hypothetical protein